MSLVSLKHVIENRSERERDVMNFMVDIINNNDERKEMMSYSIDKGLKHVDEFEVGDETYRVKIGRHKDIYLSSFGPMESPVNGVADLVITRLNDRDLSEPSIEIVLTIDNDKNIVANDIHVNHEEYGTFGYDTIAALLAEFIGV
jgi:hypothetical protein